MNGQQLLARLPSPARASHHGLAKPHRNWNGRTGLSTIQKNGYDAVSRKLCQTRSYDVASGRIRPTPRVPVVRKPSEDSDAAAAFLGVPEVALVSRTIGGGYGRALRPIV